LVGQVWPDTKRTNMKNYGVQPDILVENAPEDNLAGGRGTPEADQVETRSPQRARLVGQVWPDTKRTNMKNYGVQPDILV